MDGLISIIMPVYNAEKYLPNTIESLLNQTYHNLELILVDDGSTDKSGRICDEYANKDKRVTVIHKENSGVSSARNAGMNIMQGEYLYFIDSDDELHSDALQNFVYTFSQYDTDVIIFGWNVIDITKGTKKRSVSPGKSGIADKNHIMDEIICYDEQGGGGYPWNKIWRVRNKKDIPRFRLDLFAYEDKLWVLEMLCCYSKIWLEGKEYYNYFVRNTSLSHKKYTADTWRSVLLAHYRICEIVRDLDENLCRHSDLKYQTAVSNALFYGVIHSDKELIKELKGNTLIRLKWNQSDYVSYIKNKFIRIWKHFSTDMMEGKL
ncbi:MAG: glycosyltransferase family 2 protein [Lachnospiraceae bacterium]|nr:glycosyltransferase family 2 protein [Lachnospiraceae bacterium]